MYKTPDSLIGQRLGNYQIKQLIGNGGFADVYLGENIHINKQVAIKVLHINIGQQEQAFFIQEARTITSLEHPHIVKTLDFGIQNGLPYLIMDYAMHGTLRQRYPHGMRIAPEFMIRYVEQAAMALQHAHTKGYVHRDIKPENMLLDANNNVLLSDFGIAFLTKTSQRSSLADISGTVYYMAPEQLLGKPEFASDQYSLAIIVYEWLTGVYPFNGSFAEVSSQHLHAEPPPPSTKVEGISPDVEQVVLRALEKQPNRRFPNIEAFASALRQAIEPTMVRNPYHVIPPPPPPPFTPPNTSNHTPPTLENSTKMQTPPTPLVPKSLKNMPEPSPVSPPVQRKSVNWLMVSIVSICLLTTTFSLLYALMVSGITKTTILTNLPNVTHTSTSMTNTTNTTQITPTTEQAHTPTPSPTIAVTPTPTQVVTPGTVLYEAGQAKGWDGWNVADPWKFIDDDKGKFIGSEIDQSSTMMAPYTVNTKNYAAEVRFVYISGKYIIGARPPSDTFGIIARGREGYVCSPSKNTSQFAETRSIMTIATITSVNDLNWLKSTDYKLDHNAHTLRIEVKNNNIRCLVDGQELMSIMDNTYLEPGDAGVFASLASINIYNFKITAL